MAYQKQTFKDNETVLKAEHLDHIEYGIVSSAELDEEHIAHFKNCLGVVLFSIDLSGLGVPLEYGDLVLSAESLTIAEGGSGTFTVKLASAPSVKQTVYLALSDNTKLSVSPAMLVFTPDNWETEQTVTLTAAQDEDMKNDTITVMLTSKNVEGKQLAVSVTDDDIPVLVEDGLWFNLNLRGRTADNGEGGDHSVVDSVNGYVCTVNHCDFDGETDGFMENGLKLRAISDITDSYVVSQPTQYPSIQLPSASEIYGVNSYSNIPWDNTQKAKATIEVTGIFAADNAHGIGALCCYDPFGGLEFASTGYHMYPDGATPMFYNTDGTKVSSFSPNNLSFTCVNKDGTITQILDAFDFSEEHTLARTQDEDGTVCYYIDGYPVCTLEGIENNSYTLVNFSHRGTASYISDIKCYTGSQRRDKDAPQTYAHIRIYQRALTPAEIKENYKFDVSQRSVSDF